MTDPSQTPTVDALALDEEGAMALDAALDALQAGRPLDRAALLARHPQLESALAVLERLVAPPPTLMDTTSPVSAAPLPAQIGPYRVLRELGAGGFGTVYLAFDPDLKRQVAIKMLHSRPAGAARGRAPLSA